MFLRSRYAGLSGGLRCSHALQSHTMQHRNYERQPVVHARNRRRTAADEVEDAAADGTPPQQEIVRSSRHGFSERRNNRITRTAQQIASPFDTLRQMNIVTTDENGDDIVDLSCLGRGEPHWYAVGIMENKETKYLKGLAEVMDEYGISFDPERLYTPPSPGDAAAAEAAAALLQENEVTAWIPSKTMMVYSHNMDKLVERTVHYGRGTGGAWLMLHMTLSPLLVDLVQETYYYLGWRHEQEITARMLEQAGLLPGREDKEEVYKLPVPCTPDVIQQMVTWQYTEESEDLEQQRQQYYGIGGGSVFGEVPSKAERLKGMERDAAGNIVQKRYTAGTYDNPGGWSEGGSSSSSSRGRGGSSSRGGRGGRGQAGRDNWQQQQQPLLPWDDQPWQQQGGWTTAASSSGSWNNTNNKINDSYNTIGNNINNSVGNRNNNVGGSNPSVRLQQMDYMQEMGSGRYSGSDSDGQQQQQGLAPQQDRAKPRGAKPRDDSVRLQQMDFMGEMGSGRYSDEEDDDLNPQFIDQRPAGFSGRSGVQTNDLGYKDLEPQGAGYVKAKGLGGRGDKVRQRQMDYMQEMGSGRYSDEDDSDLGNWTGGRGKSSAAAAAARDDKVRPRQMDYMEEMGSERYSSASDDDDDFSDPDWKPNSRSGGSSSRRGAGTGRRGAGGSSGSFMSDVAAAFEGYDPTAASFLAQQQQKNLGRQQQQGWQGAAGAGKASAMDEDNLSWGNDDSAAAAAREQYNAWQQDQGSDQGLNNSFNLDDFGDDVLLQQLAQMPPVDIVPSKKGRGRAAAPAAAAAAVPVEPKASKKTKKGLDKASRQAAAKGLDNDQNLGLGGVGSDDEGFEKGWVDRIMSDGNDRVGLDDIMQE